MIKYLIRLTIDALKLIKKIGIKQFFKYHLARKHSDVPLNIYGHAIQVRQGSPDLEVALSCLGGEFEILRYLFRQNFNGLIVDAGGYIGTSAIALKSIFPNAQIVAVEPAKLNVRILKSNINSCENISVIEAVLSPQKKDKATLFDRSTGQWGFTAVSAPKDVDLATPMHEVDTVTLAEIEKIYNKKISILKLDIEGGEHELFNAARKSLDRIPVIFTELHEPISPGCEQAFFDFSKDRIVIKSEGEKFLSIAKTIFHN